MADFPTTTHPTLQTILDKNKWTPQDLGLQFPLDHSGHAKLDSFSKNCLQITDGTKSIDWDVASLRELYRGDRVPPSLSQYPEEYVPFFYTVEETILVGISYLETTPTDEQFIEYFNTLRRRPDGKVKEPMCQIIWQAACLGLAKYPYSQAEYEAMMNRLKLSAKTWRMGFSSRNYAKYISKEIGR